MGDEEEPGLASVVRASERRPHGAIPRYFGGSFSGAIERHIPAPHCAIGLVALRTKVASILPLSSGIEATP